MNTIREKPGPEKITVQLRELAHQLDKMELAEPIGSLIDQVGELVGKLEREVSSLNEEAKAAEEDKARFVNVVTHELRVPLTSIKGYTDLLRQGAVGPVNEQQSSFLTIIRNNVDRMAALISDLSDISHIQSDRLKLHIQNINLNELVDGLLVVWKPVFEQEDQRFTIQLDQKLTSVQIDPIRFKQILNYLLSNANRYTPQQGHIDLRLTEVKEHLRVEVRDNGIGISFEDQKKLFTPFFRSEAIAVREQPGWGLSLHVAQLLVEQMGGTIGFASESGKGSTFWIEVPAQQIPSPCDD
jgi:signal transduction histidine kinase